MKKTVYFNSYFSTVVYMNIADSNIRYIKINAINAQL
jgi:hypothetical protein